MGSTIKKIGNHQPLKQVMVTARERSLKTALDRKRGRRPRVAFTSSSSFMGCLGLRWSAMAVFVIITMEATRDAI